MQDSQHHQEQQQAVSMQLLPADDGQVRVVLHVTQPANTAPASPPAAAGAAGALTLHNGALTNGDAMEADSSSGEEEDSSSSSDSSSSEEEESEEQQGSDAAEPMDYAEMREMIDRAYK
jgi:hypothetical protein